MTQAGNVESKLNEYELKERQKLMADAQLKEIIIEAASECNFLPQELAFYTWLLSALGLQKV